MMQRYFINPVRTFTCGSVSIVACWGTILETGSRPSKAARTTILTQQQNGPERPRGSSFFSRAIRSTVPTSKFQRRFLLF